MRPVTIKLGYWSAVSITITFVIFTVCFGAIGLTSPPFVWVGTASYLAYVAGQNQFFHHLARLAMLQFAPAFVILLNCVHDLARDDQRVLTRLALCFGVAFATLVTASYFIQLSAARLSILQGKTQQLEQITQANPLSAVFATNVLGWSLFFGLASVFIAPAFSEGTLGRLIGYSFLLNGVFCLLGGLGYALDVKALVYFTLNFGMGGTVLFAAVCLWVYFRRAGAKTGYEDQGPSLAVADPAVGDDRQRL